MDDFRPPDAPMPATPRLAALGAVVFEGSLGVVALLLGWLFGLPAAGRIPPTFSALGLGALAALPLLVLFFGCVHCPWKPFRRLLRVVRELIVPLLRGCTVLELAAIAIAAGVGEEMLFRAIVQEVAAGSVEGPAGPWVGLVAASLIFGLVHLVTPTYGILATLIGGYLGWLWMTTGILMVPVTAHAVYDFVGLVYLMRVVDRRGAQEIDRRGAQEIDRRGAQKVDTETD